MTNCLRLRHLFYILITIKVCSATYYKIEGHLNSISADDVRPILTNRTAYLKYEEALIAKLEDVLAVKLDQFFIDKFEIHGNEKIESAIFLASISTSLSRAEIVSAVGKSDDLTIFHIMETDFISAPSVSDTSDTEGVYWCVNGGIFLPNNTCICPSFYTGDQCENIQCLHHGILDGNRCACPPGVYAVNCESRSCAPGVKDNMDVSKQTFMLVVSQKISMAYVLNTLIAEVSSLLNDINTADPNLIQNYIVVNYLDGKNAYYMQKMFTNDANKFVSYLGGINVVDGNDLQPTNTAILTAQSFAPLMRSFSNIFVFADSPDSDATTVDYTYSKNTTELNTILKTKAWRNRIVYLLSQTADNKINSTGDNYDVYRRVAKATLGDIIVMDISEINKVIDPMLSYYRQNEIIAVRYGVDKDEKIDIVGDSSQQFVYILITVDPTGVLPVVDGLQPEAKGKLWMLFRTYHSVTSSITPKTGFSLWNIRIWVESGNTGIISYSNDPMVDVGTLSCMSELQPIATAVAIGFSNSMTLEWVSLYDGKALANGVAGTARTSECTFPVTFPNIDPTCTPGPFANKLTFVTNKVVTQRFVPGFCAKLDHHLPAPFVCLNGGTVHLGRACTCGHNWNGTHCETPICTNRGTPDAFPGNGRGPCLCPYGYSGDFCEQLICKSPSTDNFDTSKRSLSVVVQSSMSQAFNNIKILTGIANLVGQFNGADSFNEYVVTYYNTITKDGQPFPVQNTTKYLTATDFQAGLQSTNIKYQASQAPSMDLLGSLARTVAAVSYAKSAIFVFVDSPLSQNGTLSTLIEAAVLKELEVSIIITPPFNMPNLCMNSDSAAQLGSLAVTTGGNIINLCNKYGTYPNDPIIEFLTTYGSTHHHVENLDETVVEGKCYGTLRLYTNDLSLEIYLFANGVVTEDFVVTLHNIDTANSIIQTPINIMPFMSIYKIIPDPSAIQGYTVYIAANKTSQEGQCNFRIVERTNLTLTLGFTSDPSTDSYSKTLFYATDTYPVMHISQPFTGPNQIIIIEVDKPDGYDYVGLGEDGYRPSPCRYETFVSQPYACDVIGQYVVFQISYSHEKDAFGIQRSKRGFCFLPAKTCLNGGFMDENGVCVCGIDYFGPVCEFPNCRYKQQTYGFDCQCSSNFTGQLCQYRTCNTWNLLETQDPRQGDFKQITFVLNINKDQLLPNIFLNNAMKDFIGESESNDIPKQYSLITFDQTQITNVISTSHTAQFLDIFNSTISHFTPTIATQTRAADALNEAYKINIQPPEIIYLFTGTDTLSTTQALNALTRQRIGTQVNVIYTPQNVDVPQQPAGDHGYLLTFAARQSGGRVLPMTQYAVNGIDRLLGSMIRENALIHDDAVQDCSNGTTFSFYLEGTFNSLVLDITGNGMNANGSIVVLDAGGKEVYVPDNMILLSDTAAAVYKIEAEYVDTPGGSWKVQVKTSSGSCFLQARADTNTHVIPGFTSDNMNDFVKNSPFSVYGGRKHSTYMTFRVVDQISFPGDLDTTLTSLSISSTDYEKPWRSNTQLHSVAIHPRDPNACANQFVTDQWSMNANTYQKFLVLGKDISGITFQRTFFYTMPSAADEDATCVGGYRNNDGECICDSNHSGDYCTDRRCQNGGSPSYGICVCANGYHGDFCEEFLLAK